MFSARECQTSLMQASFHAVYGCVTYYNTFMQACGNTS